ncbi:nuclear transport factor 2 family protein [Actinorhabdospora filicis]|nr:nuclear transport factor 2 family protein [Actinorhabdospora filicis]
MSELAALEHRRLKALVAAEAETLDALHAPDFLLVHPSGGVWTKSDYIGGILSGEIRYHRFEALTEIQVMADTTIAVLRYRSSICIQIGGNQPGELEAWHTDSYRREDASSPWRVVWSQATAID